VLIDARCNAKKSASRIETEILTIIFAFLTMLQR